jgi:hypothetical protein
MAQFVAIVRGSTLVGARAQLDRARHGSTRYLWRDEAVAAACSYVRDQ